MPRIFSWLIGVTIIASCSTETTSTQTTPQAGKKDPEVEETPLEQNSNETAGETEKLSHIQIGNPTDDDGKTPEFALYLARENNDQYRQFELYPDAVRLYFAAECPKPRTSADAPRPEQQRILLEIDRTLAIDSQNREERLLGEITEPTLDYIYSVSFEFSDPIIGKYTDADGREVLIDKSSDRVADTFSLSISQCTAVDKLKTEDYFGGVIDTLMQKQSK